MSSKPRQKKRGPSLILGVVLGSLVFSNAFGQERVRFIVAFAPGGIADTVARLIGNRVSEQAGKPVIVENRGGAGGNLAARAVATMPADGSIYLVHTAAFAINPSLYREAGYEAQQFVPVALIATTPEMIAAHPSVSAANIKQLFEEMQRKPLTYSTAGIGTSSHLTGDYLLRHLGGMEAVHVPYQGGTPAVAAAMANQVTLVSTSMPTAVPQVRAGKLKGIAVMSARRSSALPDVPTTVEAGIPLEASGWVGILGPPGMREEVSRQMNRQVSQALRQREVRERLENLGFEPAPGSAEEFAAYLRKEVSSWANIVRTAGVKQD
jgi:tripartite-type tricarboxylate transporter receptor subunit TctC